MIISFGRLCINFKGKKYLLKEKKWNLAEVSFVKRSNLRSVIMRHQIKCVLRWAWSREYCFSSSTSAKIFFFYWRLITLQYCIGFAIHWHESAMDLHVFPFPIPPPASLPIPSLWVIPVHQPRALVSCIQPGMAIHFTYDNIHVSMPLSQIIPPLLSPTESKRLFYTSVSLFLFCI